MVRTIRNNKEKEKMIGEVQTREDKDIFIKHITKLVNDNRVIEFEVEGHIDDITGPKDKHQVLHKGITVLSIRYR